MTDPLSRAVRALHAADHERDLMPLAELDAQPDWGLTRAAILAFLEAFLEDETLVEEIARDIAKRGD